MLKTCLVTFFGDNYGACLQTYATQETLRKLGCDVQILNYEYRSENRKDPFLNIMRKRFKNIPHYLFHYFQIMDFKAKKKLSARAFHQFRSEMLNIMEEKFYEAKEISKKNFLFDVYVAGSDQIWNPTFYGCCNPVYYLDFVCNEAKRISYASSIGVSVMPEEYVDEFRRLVLHFDAVSIREKKGSEIVEKLCQRNVPTVLDPTLLLTDKQWDAVCSKPIIDGEYIFCYLFSDNPAYNLVKKKLKKELNCKIVSIPFVFREAESNDEKVYHAGPAEFISLIKNAKMILTDSFHATAFSITYRKDFLVLERQNKKIKTNMNSRIYSIIGMLGIQDRLIKPYNFKSINNICKIDYDRVYDELENQRKYSIEYLKGALYEKNL